MVLFCLLYQIKKANSLIRNFKHISDENTPITTRLHLVCFQHIYVSQKSRIDYFSFTNLLVIIIIIIIDYHPYCDK